MGRNDNPSARRQAGAWQRRIRLAGRIVGLALAADAGAQETFPPYYTLYDGSGGVTCAYWNLNAKLGWRNRGGDWIDGGGNFQGGTPIVTAAVGKTGKSSAINFDVTDIVKAWGSTDVYRGILLRILGSGTLAFHARESRQAPVLTIQYADGSNVSVRPQADSYLDCTTAYAKGQAATLILNPSQNVLLGFDAPRRADVSSASLRLTTSSSFSGSTAIGFFQLRPPEAGQNIPVEPGLAAAYPADEGIEGDPDVFFVERFENADFYQRWGYATMPATWTAEVIESDDINQFEGLLGKAFRVRIKARAHYGTSLELKTQQIADFPPDQPDQLYFRYYIRFAPNFRDTGDGGKLAGQAGDTTLAGNGGQPSDGTNGWSLRGSFFNTADVNNPAYPRILLGTYAYHADMQTIYGDHWPWQQNGLGLVTQNRWYAVEQYVKVNTPGQRDGILKVWIDGKPAYARTDLNLRTVAGWPIHKVWTDIYYGGSGTPSHELTLFIDNLVVARRYIGPMVPAR